MNTVEKPKYEDFASFWDTLRHLRDNAADAAQGLTFDADCVAELVLLLDFVENLTDERDTALRDRDGALLEARNARIRGIRDGFAFLKAFPEAGTEAEANMERAIAELETKPPLDFQSMLACDFDDLGIVISVKLETPPTKTLGSADTRTGEICIEPNQPALGKVVVLVHEMMHIAEGSMLQGGFIKENINHDFIGGASLGIGIALARCGLLRGIGGRDVEEFATHPEYEAESDDKVG